MEGSSQAHEVSPLRSDLQAKGLSQRLKGLSRSSGTDWQRAGVPGETVVDIIVKGLVVDQGLDRLALTASGRAVLKAITMALLSDLQKIRSWQFANGLRHLPLEVSGLQHFHRLVSAATFRPTECQMASS